MKEIYRFEIKGHIDRVWDDWLDDVKIEKIPEGITIITGILSDQTALFSVISRIRDLGLTLLKVEKYDRKEKK